jgi:[ribosomal protein S5]-alanine N-acetyltransferase
MILLETQRLILRRITPDDFDNLHRMNSDPVVMKYVGDGTVRNREQMLGEIEMLISHYIRKPGLGVWAVELRDSHVFVGASGLVYYDNTKDIEVGYRFLKEHWNKGYATEAASALLKYGFEKLGLKKIVSSAHMANRASTRVMEKIGMRYVDDRFHYNSMQSYYEISRREYDQRKAKETG